MPSLYLRIVLKSDVVLSADAATVGAHRTLTRIRGANLLGACAANGYEGSHSFDLFHSGRVRYGDALPEADGAAALPIPGSLHRGKVDERKEWPCWNLAIAEPPAGEQMVAERTGFVSQAHRRVEVATSYTMRTAIGGHGRARGGFLFGMESLDAAQVFLARVDADTDELLEQVEQRLVDREHRLGRSRSAEFGVARIERAEEPPAWPTASGEAGALQIWCVADLALRDAHTGAPRLLPHGADFGAPNATLDLRRSFIRAARWSPWNGKRRRPDLERQVIQAGSVLTFTGDFGAVAAVETAVAAGVGDYVHEGLGQVLVQPALLASPRVELRRAESSVTNDRRPAPMPADDLGRWLGNRVQEQEARSRAWELSRSWVDQMRGYKIPAAQWGELRRLAALARVSRSGRTRLLEEFRRRFERGVSARRWGVERGGVRASTRLIHLINEPAEGDAVHATELLAARMGHVSRQESTR